jgi:hypothetical protein
MNEYRSRKPWQFRSDVESQPAATLSFVFTWIFVSLPSSSTARRQRLPIFLAAATLLITCSGLGQDPLSGVLKMGFTDVAETKRKAEAGDLSAQLSLANTLAGNLRPADALEWYKKAAAQGSIEAVYRIGGILLSGAAGVPMEKAVKADPRTGVKCIFCAATNRYTAAYYDMHRIYRDGIGVAKDLVQAYAWLQLDVNSTVGFVSATARQAELNRLALDVDVATSQEGKRLAALYKAGQWPELKLLPPTPAPVPKVATPTPKMVPAVASTPAPKPDPGLKLNGIAFGNTPLAIINGKGVAEGETVTLPLKPKPVTLKCVKIETNAVVVMLEGEDTVRRIPK